MLGTLLGVIITLLLSADPAAWTQEPAAASDQSNVSDSVGLVVGHPFSAIKYARQVRVLPGGKLEFIRNKRYPIQIARDNEGRLMMQILQSDDLQPECDQLDLAIPPACPSWSAFVIDPVAHTVAHWPEGEIAAHIMVDFPLTAERLQEAADLASTLPALGPGFTAEDGKVTTVDLGDREIQGISAHGIRWTLQYDANQDGQTLHHTRIHEVWVSAEMKLIARVIDGDPNGEETVWGLEKVSLAPDAALFHPPEGYEVQHRTGMIDQFIASDFQFLQQWFAR
jgi:hypothetical protein